MKEGQAGIVFMDQDAGSMIDKWFGRDLLAPNIEPTEGIDLNGWQHLRDDGTFSEFLRSKTSSRALALSWRAGYWLAQIPLHGSVGWALGLAGCGHADVAARLLGAADAETPMVQLEGASGEATHIEGRPITANLVPYAAVAGRVLVAFSAGPTVKLVLVPVPSPGVLVNRAHTMFSNASADVAVGSADFGKAEIVGFVSTAAFATAQAMNSLMRAAYLGGATEASLEMAVRYVKQRSQFGKPIGSLQAVQHALADVCADLEAVRELVVYAQKTPFDDEHALYRCLSASLLAKEVSALASATCMHVFGGKGFLKEGPIERYYRAIKQVSLEQGGSEKDASMLARLVKATQ